MASKAFPRARPAAMIAAMRWTLALLAACPLSAQVVVRPETALDPAREAQRLVRQLELPARCSDAWRRLVQIGAPAAPALAMVLDDPRPEVAVRAAHVLALLGERGAAALPQLRAPRPKAAAEVQHACAWAAAQIAFRGTLLIDYGDNCVLHLDDAGKDKVRLDAANAKVQGPWDAEPLADGCYLVSEFQSKAVRELDATGKELWKFADGLGDTYDADRLPNGNTLICDASNGRVIEVDRAGKLIWEAKDLKRPTEADRLPDGHTLIADYAADKVLELDAQGKVVWERGELEQPMGVDRLPNGNTLVACYHGGRVIEIAPDGTPVGNPFVAAQAQVAQRLPNGNTLVAATKAWIEFDAKGGEVWRRAGSYAVGIRRQ